MTQKKWRLQKRGSADLLKHLIELRSLSEDLLDPDFNLHLNDPNLLPDIDKAKNLIKKAVNKNWRVAVFGDYDADGTPASVLLSDVLDRLGLQNDVYLPNRTTGYGLQKGDVEKISTSAQLLITVDTGISSVEHIKSLKEKGIPTIVIDHHLPHGELPPASAIIDPFVPGSKYPFNGLCGCALAFKFATSLREDFPQLTEGFLKWQLDLVAISTVADMMSLVGENRVLVHYGLQVLRKTPRLGLRALFRQAGINQSEITAGTIGFAIGPRLNAAGRINDNRPVYQLLKTTDPVEAEEMAAIIELANRKRQQMVGDVLERTEKILWQQNSPSDKLLIVIDKDLPAGVVGLVAGRLAEQYYRPVIVGCETDGLIRASARSIKEFPIIHALEHTQELLDQFGGHAQAAGLSVRTDLLEKLTTNLKSFAAAELGSVELVPSLSLDAELALPEARGELATMLERLEPFGLGNPRPNLLLKNVMLRNIRPMGNGKHLRFTIEKDNFKVAGVGFQMAERYNTSPPQQVHLAGILNNNTWNGITSVQFQVVDFKDASEQIEEES